MKDKIRYFLQSNRYPLSPPSLSKCVCGYDNILHLFFTFHPTTLSNSYPSLRDHEFISLPFPKRQNLDASKLKDVADDNFKFDENGRKLFIRVENIVGKGEIARYEQFLLFPQCFQKLALQTRRNQGLFGKGLKNVEQDQQAHACSLILLYMCAALLLIYINVVCKCFGFGRMKSFFFVRYRVKLSFLKPFRNDKL